MAPLLTESRYKHKKMSSSRMEGHFDFKKRRHPG
jgi:hypothetical protein